MSNEQHECSPNDSTPQSDESSSQSDRNHEYRGKDLLRENSQAINSNGGRMEGHRTSIDASNAQSIERGISAAESSEIHTRFAARSGPLPDVSEFSGYENTLPGAAHRIVSMAEKSVDAYHQTALADAEMQRAGARSIDNKGVIERRQQIIFAVIMLIALAGSFSAMWVNKTVPSVVTMIVVVASGYGVYRTNKDTFKIYSSSKEDE